MSPCFMGTNQTGENGNYTIPSKSELHQKEHGDLQIPRLKLHKGNIRNKMSKLETGVLMVTIQVHAEKKEDQIAIHYQVQKEESHKILKSSN